jgi:integrase
MAGADDFTLMEIMGHSDIKMMRWYAHLTREHKRAAIARLPNWGVTGSAIQSVEGR